MAIPRFNATVTNIQVPTMTNYQQEENASIAKSLGDFGGEIFKQAAIIAIKKKIDEQSKYSELVEEGNIVSSNDGVA